MAFYIVAAASRRVAGGCAGKQRRDAAATFMYGYFRDTTLEETMRKYLHAFIIGVSILAASPARAGGSAVASANAALLQPLPVPVRRTILGEISTGILDSISRTNGDDGEVIYDVNFTLLGKPRNLTVGMDGRLLDTRVYPDELPAPAQAAIKSLSAGGQLGEITKNISDNDTDSFEADITRDGVTRTVTVDDHGALLEMQVLLRETPPSVQQTINAQEAGAIPGDIKKIMDGDDISYDVLMTKADRKRGFTVSTNGELLEEQAFPEELPQAVQTALQAQAKRGRLGKISRSTEEGKVYYEVALTIGQDDYRVTFDAAGALDSEEEDIAWAALPPKVKIVLHPFQVAGEDVDDVVRTTKGTNTTYDVVLRNGKTRRTLTFDKNGQTLPP